MSALSRTERQILLVFAGGTEPGPDRIQGLADEKTLSVRFNRDRQIASSRLAIGMGPGATSRPYGLEHGRDTMKMIRGTWQTSPSRDIECLDSSGLPPRLRMPSAVISTGALGRGIDRPLFFRKYRPLECIDISR